MDSNMSYHTNTTFYNTNLIIVLKAFYNIKALFIKLFIMKKIYLLHIILGVFLLCSCSDLSEQEFLSRTNEVISDMDILKSYNLISNEEYENAIQNMKDYENSFFISVFWSFIWRFIIILFIGLVCCCYYIYETSENTKQLCNYHQKSIAILNQFLLLLGSGIGLHWIFYKRKIWITITCIILTFAYLCVNLKYILYFDDVHSLRYVCGVQYFSLQKLGNYYIFQSILIFIFFANFTCGVLFILNRTLFNYLKVSYFKIGNETDRIISGEKTKIRKYIEHQIPVMLDKCDNTYSHTKNILNNENCTIYDASDEDCGGWGLNLLTFGKINKLKHKKGRLRALVKCNDDLRKSIETLSCYCNILTENHNICIKTANNDFSLCKNLISEFMYTTSQQQTNVRVRNTAAKIAKKNMQCSIYGDSFDSNYILKNSDWNIDLKLKNYYVPSNLSEAILGGGIVSCIDYTFGANSRANQALESIEIDISNAKNDIKDNLKSVLIFEKEFNKQKEIMTALDNYHIRFIKIYEDLRVKIYGKPTIINFIFGKIIRSRKRKVFLAPDFQKKLHLLCVLCNEYNNIIKNIKI